MEQQHWRTYTKCFKNSYNLVTCFEAWGWIQKGLYTNKFDCYFMFSQTWKTNKQKNHIKIIY